MFKNPLLYLAGIGLGIAIGIQVPKWTGEWNPNYPTIAESVAAVQKIASAAESGGVDQTSIRLLLQLTPEDNRAIHALYETGKASCSK